MRASDRIQKPKEYTSYKSRGEDTALTRRSGTTDKMPDKWAERNAVTITTVVNKPADGNVTAPTSFPAIAMMAGGGDGDRVDGLATGDWWLVGGGSEAGINAQCAGLPTGYKTNEHGIEK